MQNGGNPSVVQFAQKFAALLEATEHQYGYKLALLISILEEVAAGVDQNGLPSRRLAVTALTDRVLRLYWRQTRPIDEFGHARQGQRGSLRSLVDHVAELQRQLGVNAATPLDGLLRARPMEMGGLREKIRRALVVDAIPRLQKVGPPGAAFEDRFIYEFSWVTGRTPPPDAELELQDGAPMAILELHPLLLALVRQEWVSFAARRNADRVDNQRLEDALFGADRVALSRVRDPLLRLRRNCPYCNRELRKAVQVDHFLPFSISYDDGLDNLVAAHPHCNNRKSDSLASAAFLQEWWSFIHDNDAALAEVARDVGWERNQKRTAALARGIYFTRAASGAYCWLGGKAYGQLDFDEVARALGR